MGNGVPVWLIPVVVVVFLVLANGSAQTSAKRYEALGCVKTAETLEQAKDCVYGVD